MSLTNIGGPLTSQPINDNYNFLDTYISNTIKEYLGYGIRSGLVISAQTPTATRQVNVSAGIAYLPNGRRVSTDGTSTSNFDYPDTVLYDHGTVYTTGFGGTIETAMSPITDNNGAFAGVEDVEVLTHPGGSVVTVTEVNASDGIITTSLSSGTDVTVKYRHGRMRKDIIVANQDGSISITKGTSADSNPDTPSKPSDTLRIAVIDIYPKNLIRVEEGDISEQGTDFKGIHFDGTNAYTIQGDVLITGDLTVMGQHGEGTDQVEVLNVTGHIHNPTDPQLTIQDNLYVAGNITLDGTVDGRDIDSDGSTLDSHIVKTVDEASTNDTKDKHLSNALARQWELHRLDTGNTHNTNHNQLGSIATVSTGSTDSTLDKHVSNALAKGWQDHMNNDGTHKHLALGTSASTAYRGDRGLIAYDHSQVTGNAHSMSHSNLSSIMGASSSANTDTDKHISDAMYNLWESHRNSTGNPHGTLHSDLGEIYGADPTLTDAVQDKHISHTQAKTWEDHLGEDSPHSGHATLDEYGQVPANELGNVDSMVEHGDEYHVVPYEPAFDKGSAFNKNFGSSVGTVCQGNDSRLSDSRTPTTHDNLAHDPDFEPAFEKGTAFNADFGVGYTNVARGDHGHNELHTRKHTMTSSSDHEAGNWRIFYSNASGVVTELALASSGFLRSNGTTTAPSFADAPVTSINTQTGAVTLTHSDVGAAPVTHATQHLPTGSDSLTTAAPSTVQVQTNTTGTANSYSRSDHLHNVSVGSPIASAPGHSQANGSSTSLARADHRHARESFATPSAIGASNASGSSSNIVRADHVHAHGSTQRCTHDHDELYIKSGDMATGSSTFVGQGSTRTIAHGLGSPPSSVSVTPTANPNGYLGEVWVIKDTTNIYVGNSGSAIVSFDWIAIK